MAAEGVAPTLLLLPCSSFCLLLCRCLLLFGFGGVAVAPSESSVSKQITSRPAPAPAPAPAPDPFEDEDEEEEEEEDEEEEEEGEPEPLAASRATLNRRAMPLRAVVRMGEGAMKDADTGRCRATGEGGNTGLVTAAANCMAGCTWTGG